jgi:hypothetical protein
MSRVRGLADSNLTAANSRAGSIDEAAAIAFNLARADWSVRRRVASPFSVARSLTSFAVPRTSGGVNRKGGHPRKASR